MMCITLRMQRLTLRKHFPLEFKVVEYKRCVRSVMLIRRETWCQGMNEKGILHRTDRAMDRRMCGLKLVGKKSTVI